MPSKRITVYAIASCQCRATYAAEQSVQKLEKGKKEQDLLIDHLHQQVRTQEQQIAIYTQQYEAQRRESRAAKEMLAGAEAEMEGIHFEKKQLTAQWQSSLIATQRRDQALRVSLLQPACYRQACLLPLGLARLLLEVHITKTRRPAGISEKQTNTPKNQCLMLGRKNKSNVAAEAELHMGSQW